MEEAIGLNTTMNETTEIPTVTTSYIDCANASSWKNITNSSCHTNTERTKEEKIKDILSILVGLLVAVVMIGIGCAIEAKKVVKHFKNPTGIVTGIVCQFVIMPLLAYMWASIFNMADPETMSLLIVGSCPGGTMSNIVAYWVGGDMELSAVMTTVSVTISLGMLPLLLYIYSRAFEQSTVAIPFSTIGTTMALIIIPLGIGAFLRYKFPRAALKVLKIFSIFGAIALALVGGLSIYLFSGYWKFQNGQVVTAILFPVCGMILGYGRSSFLKLFSECHNSVFPIALSSIISVIAKPLRLTHRQRRTVSVETGIQNQQIAISIIQLSGWSMEVTGRIVVFPMMYGLAQVGWCIVYIALYHLVSFARHGKCPLRQEVFEDPEQEKPPGGPVTMTADNPAFDAKE